MKKQLSKKEVNELFRVAKQQQLPTVEAPNEVVTSWNADNVLGFVFEKEKPQTTNFETLQPTNGAKRFDKNTHEVGYTIKGARGKFIVTDYIPKKDSPEGRTAVINGVFIPKKGSMIELCHVDTWQLQILLRGYAVKEKQPAKEGGKRKKALTATDLESASIEALEAAILNKKAAIQAAKAAELADLEARMSALKAEIAAQKEA